MARDDVGVIVCPFAGQLAVARADCRGKLYYYSQAGKIAPNLPGGQRWMKANIKPLEQFEITVIAAGAPPEVKPLTHKPAPGQSEKPLTGQAEQKPAADKPFWEL